MHSALHSALGTLGTSLGIPGASGRGAPVVGMPPCKGASIPTDDRPTVPTDHVTTGPAASGRRPIHQPHRRRTNMNKYLVLSGDVEQVVEAASRDAALTAALEQAEADSVLTGHPLRLGVMLRVYELAEQVPLTQQPWLIGSGHSDAA